MIAIGISGWNYPAWRGSFYPKGLPHRSELGYAAERLTSIEINGTFYSLQRPTSFARWREEAGDSFVFAVKGGRYVTHLKRLRDVESGLANFFASGVLGLGPTLGPFLWQLHPQLSYDRQLLADFLAQLPRTTAAAVELAGRHDDKPSGDRLAYEGLDVPDRVVRHAIEVRHDSFRDPAFIAQASDAGVAVVIADTAGRWPRLDVVTTDFVYVRLHGETELYASGYDEPSLQSWARRIRDWAAEGLDVYAYFDNDMKVRAPVDAMRLIELVDPEVP